MSRKKNFQYKARRTVYHVDQYWNINYTEKYSDGTEKDFKTFIKAKSYAFAKEILLKRLREDDPSIKIKAVQGFMFHKGYCSVEKSHLKAKDWEQIRNASFPNANHTLFKYEVPRDPSKTNRFNSTNYEQIANIGFKAGEDNWSVKNIKGKTLPLEERSHMIYKGKWIPWDKVCRDNTRREIIAALIKSKNVRRDAAKLLNMSRNHLHRIMSRFPEVKWNDEYPPPAPFENARKPDPKVMSAAAKKAMKKRMDNGEVPFQLTPEQEKRRQEGRLKHIARQKKAKKERLQKQIPLVKEALNHSGNHRRKAAEYLGWTVSYLSKVMQETKSVVNWAVEYPTKHISKIHF
tara:strand:+ start:38 stop:1078 length:1041 start_codon:yes stop_codon:yes gene_type:complete